MIELVWFVGAILCWVPFSVAITRGVTGGYDIETIDYVFGTFLGALAATFWPISLVVFGVSRLVQRAYEAEHESSGSL